VTELKVGDKVTVDAHAPNSSCYGIEGVLVEIRNGYNHGTIRITKTNEKAAEWLPVGEETYLYNLTRIEEPAFTFKDIQVGDKIRRTLTRKSGTVEVREGVVAKMDYRFVTDSGGAVLAYATDTQPFAAEVVLELLDRPKKPELWEDRKPGDKIASYNKDGKLDRIFIKQDEDNWDTLVVNTSGKIQNGFDRSETEMTDYFSRYVGKYTFMLVH
jgi:hypothetical protein